MQDNEDQLKKAQQLEVEAILAKTNALRRRFTTIDEKLNKQEHIKPTEAELKEHGIGNVTFINPMIETQYKEAISDPNMSVMQFLEMFSIWTTQLECLLKLNQHRLHHTKVREHLNSIFETCKIIDVVIRKKYNK